MSDVSVPVKKRYLFLLAWMAGSDGACGEDTKVNSQEELVNEFWAGNEHVFAVEIHTDNSEVAYAFGACEAFFDNYTAHDSLSDMIEVDWDKKLPTAVKVLVV